jgi:hypothetical protein
MNLVMRLLEQGRIPEARALGAKLSRRSPAYASAAAVAVGLADAKEGWLGRGLARMRTALGGLDGLLMSRGDLSLLIQTSRLAEVAGLQGEVGEEIARHFVLSDPPRLPEGSFADVQIIAACMHAPRPVGERCIARLRDLHAADSRWQGSMEGAHELIAGAEHFARGERRAAARVWRTFAGTGFHGVFLPAEVFDEAGDVELAAKLDAPRLASSREYGGIHPAFAREARRAAARGDAETARKLARRVIEAWGAADIPIPAVAEMRALLARVR